MVRHPFPRIAGFLLVAAAILAFAGLAAEMLEGDTQQFDRAILLALRHAGDPTQPIGPRWLQETARDITSLGGNTLLTAITLAVLAYLALLRRRAEALLVLGAIGGGAILSSLLKLAFNRPRPDFVPHAMELYGASFPSGHAMLSAVTYLTLGALLAHVQTQRRTKIYLVGLAIATTLLVGVSRLYLGVHWPTDVLAGWCLGGAWALLCALTLRSLPIAPPAPNSAY